MLGAGRNRRGIGMGWTDLDIGRAVTLGDSASRWVAVGACVFMVSDSLIAINKFVTPVALSSLWILVTYYCAQMLIVHHSRKA